MESTSRKLTATAPRKLAGIDVFDETCAGHYTLGQVADRWTLLLIYALAGGTKRYGQLQRQVRGISAKMLVQNLRKLEQIGFLERKVFPVVPPMVEYSLTPLGASFVKPLVGICEWAAAHLPELREMRDKLASTPRKTPKASPPRQVPAALRKLVAKKW